MCTDVHWLRPTLCGLFPLRATWLAHWMIAPVQLSRTRPQLGDLHPTSFSHGSFPVSHIHDIPIHFCRSALTMINSAVDTKRLISSHSCLPGKKRNETEPDKSEVWELDFGVFVIPNGDKNPNRKGKLECNSFPLLHLYDNRYRLVASHCSFCSQIGYCFHPDNYYFNVSYFVCSLF